MFNPYSSHQHDGYLNLNEMNEKEIHENFIVDLIKSVEERKCLFLRDDNDCRHSGTWLRYWQDIAFHLEMKYKAPEITANACIKTFSLLYETDKKCEKELLTSTFKYSTQMDFLGRKNRFKLDGMFERKQGRFLLPAHAFLILMSLVVYVFMDYYNMFDLLPPRLILVAWMIFFFFGLPVQMFSSTSASDYDYSPAMEIGFNVFLLFMLVGFMISEPNEEIRNEVIQGGQYYLMFIILLHQCLVYLRHSVRIYRVVPFIGHIQQVISLLVYGAFFIIFCKDTPFTQWYTGYFFFPLVLLLNALMMSCYAIVLARSPEYSKTITHYSTEPEHPHNPFTATISVEEKGTRRDWF